MKRTIHILLPTAALLVVPANLHGQGASLFDEPAGAFLTSDDAALDPFAGPADTGRGIGGSAPPNLATPPEAQARALDHAVQNLQRELESLNAATKKRQAELQKQLAELVAARRAALSALDEVASNQAAATRRVALPAVSWRIGVQVDPTGKEGVAVLAVLPDTPAARGGLQPRDVIESVNGIRVRDIAALNAIINAAQGQELNFGIRRGDGRIEKALEAQRVQPDPGASPFGATGGFGGGGVGEGFGRLQPRPSPGGPDLRIVPAPPAQPPTPPRVMELRPRNLPRPNSGPDTAELQALKNEIAELRALVADLAEHLGGDDDADGGGDSDGGDDADDAPSDDPFQ